MKIIVLLYALVISLALLITSSAIAITPEQAMQAVKDFENDQNLQCDYGKRWQLPYGISSWADAHSVRASVTSGGNLYTRLYWITDGGVVTAADLPDLDPDKNPAVELQQPLTEAQALQVAEQFAACVFSDYATCTWDWSDTEESTYVHTYFVAQQTNNGALTDRGLWATVSLESGHVISWSSVDYTLPSAASATPTITVALAIDAAEAAYGGLEDLTPTTQQLRYYDDLGLVYQLTYSFTPSQKPKGTPIGAYIDAQSGDVVWADFYLGGGKPPAPPEPMDLAKLLQDTLTSVIKALASLF